MKIAISAILKHSGSTDDNPNHVDCPTGDDTWCGYNKTATLELIGAMIRNAEDATSVLIKCQQRGGLFSIISDFLTTFKKFEIMFRQLTQ